MDPVSGVLGIASATVTLGALALKIGQTLRTIASAHKQGATLIYSLIGACQAIELAWNRIDTWIRSQPPAAYASDSSFYDRLATSIEGGKIVLDALEQDLGIDAKLSPGQTSAQITWRALLNENTLRDHCTRLNLQLQCLHLLLATASLSVHLKISIAERLIDEPSTGPYLKLETCFAIVLNRFSGRTKRVLGPSWPLEPARLYMPPAVCLLALRTTTRASPPSNNSASQMTCSQLLCTNV